MWAALKKSPALGNWRGANARFVVRSRADEPVLIAGTQVTQST
jgi:hypothetical protein